MKQIITLLIISVVLSGCGVLDSLLVDEREEATMQTDSPPNLYLGTTELDLGSYCWISDDVGMCADMMPPVYEADAHITVNDDTLRLSFAGVAPSRVSAYVHPDSNLMTRIADIQLEASLDDNGIVSIPLIEQLSGNYVLVVSAFWEGNPSGDAMYTLPIVVE